MDWQSVAVILVGMVLQTISLAKMNAVRIKAVAKDANEAKALAVDAHKRINSQLGRRARHA